MVLTEAKEVLPSDTLHTLRAIREDVCRREEGGQAEEALLEELHSGAHHAPEVGGEGFGVDEVHPAVLRWGSIYARGETRADLGAKRQSELMRGRKNHAVYLQPR